METRIRELAARRFNSNNVKVTPLGGGFYGRAFLAELDTEPFRVVIKLYLFPGIAENEAIQLKTLAKHATLKMPEVYFTDIAEAGSFDALAMEYISGVNAGIQTEIPEESIQRLGDAIVENLVSYHSAIHPEGFGQLTSDVFFDDWRSYYKPVAIQTIDKAKKLYEQGELPKELLDIMEQAASRFDRIFNIPIKTARLIHGDYNTWNVMLTENLQDIAGVIDPFNCCWADSELDLYQLDNANGKMFSLLEKYSKKMPLSENFEKKRAFYELFTEINHFYDSKVSMKDYDMMPKALELKSFF